MIDVYSNYKITLDCEGSYISQEDSTPNDIVFSKFEHNEEKIINGGLFIEKIGKYLLDTDVSEIYFDESFIKLEFFNPINGEGHTINIVYERID